MSFSYEVDDLDTDSDLCVEEYGTEELEQVAFEDIDFEALGIDPVRPTAAKPGSEEKVLMLAARYAAGVPLWNDKDCYDHGPGDRARANFSNPA
jgi:hypothetical protein